MFSEKTGHPLWRIVRKSVAQAFQANNMRCDNLLTASSLYAWACGLPVLAHCVAQPCCYQFCACMHACLKKSQDTEAGYIWQCCQRRT